MARSRDREAASGFGWWESRLSKNAENGVGTIGLGHDRDGPEDSIRARDLELRENRATLRQRLLIGLCVLRAGVIAPATGEMAVEEPFDDFDFDFRDCGRK